jgi:hypothetical protein
LTEQYLKIASSQTISDRFSQLKKTLAADGFEGKKMNMEMKNQQLDYK